MNYKAKALEWAGVTTLAGAAFLYAGPASALGIIGFGLILEANEQSDDD